MRVKTGKSSAIPSLCDCGLLAAQTSPHPLGIMPTGRLKFWPVGQAVTPLQTKPADSSAVATTEEPVAEASTPEAEAAAQKGYVVQGKLERRDSFSETFAAKGARDGRAVAVRCIPFVHPSFEHDTVRGELSRLVELGAHPGVAKVHKMWEDADTLYYAQGADIGKDLVETVAEWDSFSERDAARIARELLDALRFLHDAGVAHCDLRLKNLRLVGPANSVLLIEGGLQSLRGDVDAKLMRNIFNRSHPLHLPPEMAGVINKRGKANNDARGDVWAAGVLVYVLLCGFPPIFSENVTIFLQRLEQGEWSFPAPETDHVRPPARAFIGALLVTDPARRPSAADALASEWLADVAALPAAPLGVKTALHDYVSKHRTKKAKNVVAAVTRMGTGGSMVRRPPCPPSRALSRRLCGCGRRDSRPCTMLP